MKKIRRKSTKQTERFNRKKYCGFEGVKISAVVNLILPDGKKSQAKYVFKENGDYLKIQRIDGIKKYYPVYVPLFGGEAFRVICSFFN